MADDDTTPDNTRTEPAADLKTLEPLIGTWKLSDPDGDESALSGTVSFEWMEGGHFLIQRGGGGGNLAQAAQNIGQHFLVIPVARRVPGRGLLGECLETGLRVPLQMLARHTRA